MHNTATAALTIRFYHTNVPQNRRNPKKNVNVLRQNIYHSLDAISAKSSEYIAF